MMKRIWTVWKHALGSFDVNDGYNKRNENAIGIIKKFAIVLCTSHVKDKKPITEPNEENMITEMIK